MRMSHMIRCGGAVWLAFCCNLSAHADPDPLRPLTTDRPRLTGSPFTVGAGHVQIEWGALAQSLEDVQGFELRTSSSTGFALKVGLTDFTDLEIQAEPRVTVRLDGRRYYVFDSLNAVVATYGGPVKSTGRGPTVIRVKINTSGERDDAPVASALIPFGTVDLGDGGEGLHPYGLAIPLAVRVGPRWTFRGSVQETVVSRELDFLGAAGLSAAVTPSLDAFVEFAGERIVTSPAFWTRMIDVGAAWRPFPNLQLDGAVGFGARESVSDRAFTLGLSARL